MKRTVVAVAVALTVLVSAGEATRAAGTSGSINSGGDIAYGYGGEGPTAQGARSGGINSGDEIAYRSRSGEEIPSEQGSGGISGGGVDA